LKLNEFVVGSDMSMSARLHIYSFPNWQIRHQITGDKIDRARGISDGLHILRNIVFDKAVQSVMECGGAWHRLCEMMPIYSVWEGGTSTTALVTDITFAPKSGQSERKP
jgi:hypothetical protein